MTELVKPTIVRTIQRTNGRYVEMSDGRICRWHRGLGEFDPALNTRDGRKSPVRIAKEAPALPLLRYKGETPVKAVSQPFPSKAKYKMTGNLLRVYQCDLAMFLQNPDFERVS